MPIPKSNDPTVASNYRPISLLCVVSKVVEKHVYAIVLRPAMSRNLISSKQWGFLSRRSTGTALLKVTTDWLQSLENDDSIMTVFFDLRKAFDSVPHQLLLQKLKSIQLNPYISQWISTIYCYVNRELFLMVSHHHGHQSYQESHRAQYWAHYYLSSTSIMFAANLGPAEPISTFMLMIWSCTNL